MEGVTPVPPPKENRAGRNTVHEILHGVTWDVKPISLSEKIEHTQGPPEFVGPATGLKHHVHRRINDHSKKENPFTVLQSVGGLDTEFVGRMAKQTNKHFKTHIKPSLDENNHFQGETLRNTTKEEMHCFRGILLSLTRRQWRT